MAQPPTLEERLLAEAKRDALFVLGHSGPHAAFVTYVTECNANPATLAHSSVFRAIRFKAAGELETGDAMRAFLETL